ncbi:MULTISPECIES: JmjC domain-containing protein [unclassified Legionella]|uniref:JmjC domain-containing protein n=1 Tax=unclassified Legionella TaxID=2622702 RepID=UPI001054D531|nr:MULTISPECIES: cupin domain-containing protein [unclassified Legionella]MDI9818388.1 cupin domain-containing protein [Legionella sp. PL877]
MINLKPIDFKKFLTMYWQKKPLVIRQALPLFTNPLTPDELAGLAMEEEIESRIVLETPKKPPYWHLKRGPFLEKDFKRLPTSHWTLLVQGVDRFVPEVAEMMDYFNFIPQWRMDDIMISYAVNEGSVGPHYDNYDVFLYQAMGQRKWLLTTQSCHTQNYMSDVELRIMKEFRVEEEYILEEGDMLYLPPHVGHYGISKSNACMTYSFGYRSYHSEELWQSFADYLAEQKQAAILYKDPDWSLTSGSSELPREAWINAKKSMEQLLTNEKELKSWFGCFVTRLDQQAEELLPEPFSEENTLDIFIREFKNNSGFSRNVVCRFAYETDDSAITLFINGYKWPTENVSPELIKLVADKRSLSIEELHPFLESEEDRLFLLELWKLQWLVATTDAC